MLCSRCDGEAAVTTELSGKEILIYQNEETFADLTTERVPRRAAGRQEASSLHTLWTAIAIRRFTGNTARQVRGLCK